MDSISRNCSSFPLVSVTVWLMQARTYLPGYLSTCLLTFVRRDVSWYGNTFGCRCVGMLLHPYICPFLLISVHRFIRIVLPAYLGRYFRLSVPVSVRK